MNDFRIINRSNYKFMNAIVPREIRDAMIKTSNILRVRVHSHANAVRFTKRIVHIFFGMFYSMKLLLCRVVHIAINGKRKHTNTNRKLFFFIGRFIDMLF